MNSKILISKTPCRFLSILFILPYFFGTSSGQNVAPEFSIPDISINGFKPFRITSIIQDKIGNIWYSTDLGLLSYDGYYTSALSGLVNDTLYFDETSIEVLYCDQRGQIWIGNRLGLARYDPIQDRLDSITIPENAKADHFILDITEDSNGNLWMISAGSGLLHYKVKEEKLYSFLDNREKAIHILDDTPRVLLCDRNDILWIGTGYGGPENGQGLVRFDPQSKTARRFLHAPDDDHSLLDNRVSALYEDQSGRIMVGTYKAGLHIYQPENETFKRMQYDPANPEVLYGPETDISFWDNDPFVQIIHQDLQGAYWVGTTGVGLQYFSGKENSSSNQVISKDIIGFDDGSIWTVFEDRQSNFWIGTLTNGIYRKDLFNPKYKEFEGFYYVNDFHEDLFNPGIIWVHTMGGLFKWNMHSNEVEHFLKEDSTKILYSNDEEIFQENDSILWIGLGIGGLPGVRGDGRGGLVRFNQNSKLTTYFRITTRDQPDFSETVIHISEDHQGYLWLTTTEALFRSNKSRTKFEEIELATKDSTELQFWRTQKGSEGTFWIMTTTDDGGGVLYLYDYVDGSTTPFLEGYAITNIIEDDRSKWWLTTFGEGILRYDPEDSTYRKFTKEDGLPSDKFLYLVKDSSGILWTNSQAGPVRIDPNTLQISPFADELAFSMAITAIGGLVTSDNMILFKKRDKIVTFYPDQIMGNPNPPFLKISNFEVSGISLSKDELNAGQLQFSHSENDIHIEYAGIHFSAPKENIYQYQLSPINASWIDAGTERNARYADLSPGHYIFKVKSATNNHVWSEQPLEISFTIHPPWWRTWWGYCFFGMGLLGGVLGFIQYRSNSILKKNKILETRVAERTKALEIRTHELTESLDHLEVAQQKLIQSEKLASLGELTAGIAHEIQNPLNFVNNFSEVSQELIEEIMLEIQNNSKKDALEIANDLGTNLSKILHHGKRADSIVKGMLMHSRSSSGHKELTDIKKLTDEYLRLAYHGLRAKDKSFNAHIQTTHDEQLGKVLIAQSEFGRVLLNLLTNAFYAVHERSKTGESGFKPLIEISTEDVQDEISVTIRDNGIGIPEEIKDKIFQPFFSTKPAGQGTGLGLSLAFDIVTKGHQGKILLESKEGVGTEFQIILPKNPRL